MEWREVGPLGPVRSGDIGGDEQASEAWGRRFILPPREDGLHPVMTVDFYVAYEDPEHPRDDRVLLRRQIEYALRKDPGGAGEWDVWSDGSYVRMPFAGLPTEEDARQAAERMPVPGLAMWDGQEWSETKNSPWWRAGERA